MARGFLAFALAAVFLLALVASGSLFSSQPPGSPFQKYRAMQLEDLAIKRAIYSSASQAASSALAASEASGADPYAAATAAVRLRLSSLGQEFQEAGYSVSLWCGSPSEDSLRSASVSMEASKSPLIPEEAAEIGGAACSSSFGISILERKIHFSEVGFSAYFPLLGAGFASQLPSGYEVAF